jgi:RNA polymerase sigma-70 factor (ECF subfamily)
VLADDVTAALVLRAQRGDRDAFADLVRAFLRPAYSVALAVIGRPADAEDVAQDAFLVAMERIDTCREPRHFAGWLLQIVRNRARNGLLSRRLRDVPAQSDQPEQIGHAPLPDSSVFRSQLLGALDMLSPVRREIVLLHDLEGWTHPEIAGALGVSELMSRQHLFLAHRVLREQLGGQVAEVGDG